MTKFLNILKTKLTLGSVLTIIASFIFAFLVRHLYLYLFNFLPIRGELELLDISFFGIVVLFKFIFSALLEYLMNDKFSIPLYEVIGKGVGQKSPTTLSMVNGDNEASSSKQSSSSKGKVPDVSKGYTKENDKFLDEKYEVGEKMCNVLNEQTNKILRLHSIRIFKDVKFYEENGGLELSVPLSMTDSEAEKLSKEVGAIDRGLQNKFSEFKNLSRKDTELYEST